MQTEEKGDGPDVVKKEVVSEKVCGTRNRGLNQVAR